MNNWETQTHSVPETHYRRILGVRFFVKDAAQAVDIGARGGLVVVPAAPALLELARDPSYRQALLEADLAITDSGFLVLLWNAMKRDNIHRVSGLEYLKLLLNRPEFREPGTTFWVMPSETSLQRNLAWLQSLNFPVDAKDCYVAPMYSNAAVTDDILVTLINERRPKHIIVCLGGGIQEKLGLYLKNNCSTQPAIHCTGAAIGFLGGDQVRIPDWADKYILGWLFRCISNPARFVPRYAKALRLPIILWKYDEQMPHLSTAPRKTRLN